jgi:UMF1 family MFS transporter
MHQAPHEIVQRPIAAFCLYDFGNSAFATTILAVLFNQYFAQQVAGGQTGVSILGLSVPGSTLYTWLISLTMLLVALSGPVVGAWADAAGRRMTWLRGLTLLGVGATVALVTVGPGDWVHGSLVFLVAYGSFAVASIFYNAILPSLGRPEELGRISGLAWGLGYLGGALVLVLSLVLIRQHTAFGLENRTAAVRLCFALAGVWWGLFAIPLLLHREAGSGHVDRRIGLGDGIRQVWDTLCGLRRAKHFFRYLIAFFLYKDGIETVVATASIFAAAELGFEAEQLILLFLVIQGTGFLGALVGGRLADRFGHKETILAQLAGWVVVTLWARWVGWLGDPIREFWCLGVLAGLLLGGVQTASRSLLARWVPLDRSGEIFGFFAVAGRFASVVGPLIFGAMSWATGSLRSAILSVSILFVGGAIVLAFVNEARGANELRGRTGSETKG